MLYNYSFLWLRRWGRAPHLLNECVHTRKERGREGKRERAEEWKEGTRRCGLLLSQRGIYRLLKMGRADRDDSESL